MCHKAGFFLLRFTHFIVFFSEAMFTRAQSFIKIILLSIFQMKERP